MDQVLITVQLEFHNRFNNMYRTSSMNIQRWFQKFHNTVCLWEGKMKGPGQPWTAPSEDGKSTPQGGGQLRWAVLISGMSWQDTYTGNHTHFCRFRQWEKLTRENELCCRAEHWTKWRHLFAPQCLIMKHSSIWMAVSITTMLGSGNRPPTCYNLTLTEFSEGKSFSCGR